MFIFSILAYHEKLKHCDAVYEKLKFLELQKKREMEKNQELLEKCKNYKKKKELEIQACQKSIEELNKINASFTKMKKDLEKKNYDLVTLNEYLERQNSDLRMNVEDLEKKISKFTIYVSPIHFLSFPELIL